MSEIWLVLAVESAFFEVVLAGLAIEQGSTDKKRAVRLLESQVGSSESVNLRDQELQKNFGSRVVVPVVAKAGRVARRCFSRRPSARRSSHRRRRTNE